MRGHASLWTDSLEQGDAAYSQPGFPHRLKNRQIHRNKILDREAWLVLFSAFFQRTVGLLSHFCPFWRTPWFSFSVYGPVNFYSCGHYINHSTNHMIFSILVGRDGDQKVMLPRGFSILQSQTALFRVSGVPPGGGSGVREEKHKN